MKPVYERYGVAEGDRLRIITVDPGSGTKGFRLFLSYIGRIRRFLRIRDEITGRIDRRNDVLMCHSDFFPSTIATWILQKEFEKVPYYWFHMLCPKIFRGYAGEYTGKVSLPTPSLVHFKLNQILFRRLSRNANIIVSNPAYFELFADHKTYFAGFGTDIVDAESTSREAEYDIAFMGRFHAQKGLFELLDILRRLKETKPDVKLLMIGDGNRRFLRRFKKAAKRLGVGDNIVFSGYKASEERFKLLAKARVFAFPSYYESFGIVIREAMMCGLPVVAYDLPVYNVHEKGMIKVPLLDNDAFTAEVQRLLDDEEYRMECSRLGMQYVRDLSWRKTGEKVLNLLDGSNGD
jgi:glycosyltransferase involved in cell wall biosynthesis